MATVAGTGTGEYPTRAVTGVPAHSEMGAAGPGAITIADPAPLGLAAFGITTLVLSVINAGWIGAAATPAVLALAIPFGGVAQLLAGMWAFRRGNTFAATAFTSYGAFWISFYLLVNFYAAPVAAANPSIASQVVGLYLVSWGIFTAYMFLASLGSAQAVQLVFMLLTATFFALGIAEWTGDLGAGMLHHIGGYLGVATAAAALYASFADVANANLKRTILPTEFRRRRI